MGALFPVYLYGAGATTHDADRTESASAADAQTAALTTAGAAAEALAAAETQAGALTAAGAAADALTAADQETAALTAVGAAAESLTAADAPVAQLDAVAALSEALAAADVTDATRVPAEGEVGPGPIVGSSLPPRRVTVHELVVDGEQKPQRGRVVAALTLVATSAGSQLPQGSADSVRRLAAVVQTAQAIPTGPAVAGYALKSLTARSVGGQARHGGDVAARLRMAGATDAEQTRSVGAAEADYDLTAREDELLTLIIGMAA